MKRLKLLVTTGKDGPNYNENTLRQQREFYKSIKPGTAMQIIHKPYRPPKTLQQCRMFFGLLVGIVINEMQDRGWTVTVKYGGHEMEQDPNKENVKYMLYALTKTEKPISEMTIDEMCQFYDNCADGLAREPWFIYIPPADPNWRKLKTDRQ